MCPRPPFNQFVKYSVCYIQSPKHDAATEYIIWKISVIQILQNYFQDEDPFLNLTIQKQAISLKKEKGTEYRLV